MKKKIGITLTKTEPHNYTNWFIKDPMIPDVDVIVLSHQKNNYADIASCDGFILSGGVDVHPSIYSGNDHYENSPTAFDPERDAFEAAVYLYARMHDLPVLGICRGLQLVNVLEGGSLIQDLGTQKNKTHRKDEKDKQHEVQVIENSLLHQITGILSGKVNSAHHQAIDPQQLAPSMRISARAPDGTIEAIECSNPSDHPFLLCVQWHPERMEDGTTHPFSAKIKKAFLQALNITKMHKRNIINPATEAVISTLNEDNKDSLQRKMSLLQGGQEEWEKVPLPDRIRVIEKYMALLEENKERLAGILTSEVGKPLQQSRNEINGAIGRIKWMTAYAEKYLQDENMTQQEGLTEMIRYEPLGVIGNISAWNYPYLVGTNVFIPALLSGNAVLYKPSEHACLTGCEIASLLKAAGIPDNVFQVAIGGANVGEHMLELPLNGYFFTGSYKTGKYIYEKVAPKMVVCQCELGGKDPLYVTDDVADIEAVAAATADGAFYNNGQSCCAVERIYVHEKIADTYIRSFVQSVASWKLGDPLEQDTYFGPLARKEQLEVLKDQVADALQKGATLLHGGKDVNGKGYYFEPTILTNVDHSMKVMRDESFGPIIGIMIVKDDKEAIEKMKDTEYGLTASVYSKDKERALKILEQIDSGTGYWNCCDRVSAAVPWSGRKHSGFGATLSHAGIRAFTKPKSYHLRNV